MPCCRHSANTDRRESVALQYDVEVEDRGGQLRLRDDNDADWCCSCCSLVCDSMVFTAAVKSWLLFCCLWYGKVCNADLQMQPSLSLTCAARSTNINHQQLFGVVRSSVDFRPSFRRSSIVHHGDSCQRRHAQD